MMMKNTLLYCSLIALPLLFSCTQGNKSTQKKKVKADLVVSKQCFIAIDGKDTANLEIDSLDIGKIKGHLTINYFEKEKNDGKIEGTFKGDTLFVDYTLKIGTQNKTIYKTPLALLKKNGKMVLGVGQIETSLGRSYFVKGKPINFDGGRFIFEPAECNKK